MRRRRSALPWRARRSLSAALRQGVEDSSHRADTREDA
jgi:hypothetical protein